MVADLIKYHTSGCTVDEIADKMGLKWEQVKNAIYRVKTGVYGKDAAKQIVQTTESSGPVRKSIETLDEAVAEARVRGISYGQLQTERRLASEQPDTAESTEPAPDPIDSKPAENESIDMLEAINDLAMCSITQSSRITAVFAVEGEFADIAFVRGGVAYILSLRREGTE